MKLILALVILLSGCATLESKDAAVACQAADVITTKVALTNGAVEANPLMKGVVSNFTMFLLVKGALTWWITRDETPPEARVAANVITCGVAANNLRFIK